MRKTSFQLFVSGRKGQGKTTLTDAVAAGFNRVFVYDILGEYQAKGYVVVRSMAEMRAAVRKRWKKGWRVAFVPARPREKSKTDPGISYQSQLAEMCDTICRIQMPYKETPDGRQPPIPSVLFIIEEMRWSYPTSANISEMAELTTLGRHYGVNMIGTTQRIAEVSTNFKGTSDARYFFAQDEAADIDTIARMIGRQHLPALKSLRPHQYLRMFQGRVEKGQNKLR